MKQLLDLVGPPRAELPLWGKRVAFDDFFVELVPAGRRDFNVRLTDAFASISFAGDEGRSSLAGDRLRKYDRRPYEYIVAPAGFPLKGHSSNAPEVLVIVFPFDTLREDLSAALQLKSDLLEPRVIIGGPMPFPTELAKRIRRHILADDVSGDYLRSLCFVLLVEMLALPLDQRASGRAKLLDKKILDASLKYIDANLDADLSVSVLARLCGVEDHQFSRAFKQIVGETPHRFVLARRIDTARGLLAKSDAPIAQIAYATGFSSQSHMTTMFRRHLGLTPAVVRRGGMAASVASET
ncbi:AraC family transcriptional regulator [Roseobacter sp. YSTF-M11]|uniref:AraC family transcriptional regulator n=1 Tax=Roseobacter insulae TaxID=2859783 RepID=A0A9X1JZP6_9RHOB|nr:AraC family transcriptional regulator [Roseobacter insulae]MBW4709515.1 AraC family transcriptional regulator [Roseobacter insulae]